jgi:hypothetical protein
MKLLNETLSDLKIYARKKYSLTKNVPILVMLVTEQEHKSLAETYTKPIEANKETNSTQTNESNIQQSTNVTEDFFPNVASIFELSHNYSRETTPIITPILRNAFDIPHFGKYKYAILIREEKLLEWGNLMDIQVNGVQASSSVRKIVIFYRILSHEFLHVVEREKGIRIFTDNQEMDSEIVQKAFKTVKVFQNSNIFENSV